MRDRVLFFDTNNVNCREAERVIAVVGSDILIPGSREEVVKEIKQTRFSAIVVDFETHEKIIKSRVSLNNTPIITLSEKNLWEVYPVLKPEQALTNFIVKDKEGRIKARDLMVTLKKLFGSEIFGVAKYLNFGASLPRL